MTTTSYHYPCEVKTTLVKILEPATPSKAFRLLLRPAPGDDEKRDGLEAKKLFSEVLDSIG